MGNSGIWDDTVNKLRSVWLHRTIGVMAGVKVFQCSVIKLLYLVQRNQAVPLPLPVLTVKGKTSSFVFFSSKLYPQYWVTKPICSPLLPGSNITLVPVSAGRAHRSFLFLLSLLLQSTCKQLGSHFCPFFSWLHFFPSVFKGLTSNLSSSDRWPEVHASSHSFSRVTAGKPPRHEKRFLFPQLQIQQRPLYT